jgi:hypothetical protein
MFSILEIKKYIFFDGRVYSFDLEDLLRASAEVLGERERERESEQKKRKTMLQCIFKTKESL